MLTVTIPDAGEVIDYFAKLPDTLNAALAEKSQTLAGSLVQHIRDDKLSGGVLEAKTGRLKDSIDSAVEAQDNGTSASVFVGDDIPYAAIQEYGGVTKAHIIEATRGKALAFMFAGKQAFFAHVNHPGSVIPERSYLRSAFDEMQDDIVSGFAEALDEAL